MTKRIFRSILLAALVVLLVSLVLVTGLLYSHYSAIQQEQLKNQTLLAAEAAAEQGVAYFDGLFMTDCRITWIGVDGTVLYDSHSEIDSMENHLEREEIREALSTGYGESARYSATLTESSFYSAKRLPDGTVLRLSTVQPSLLNTVLDMYQPILILLVVTLLLSMLLASRLSRTIVEPLNKLDLDDPLSNRCYHELNTLLRRLDSQQRQLHEQSDHLLLKQNEFETVTANMSEGLVLLGSSCMILTMNPAAQRILGLSKRCIGTDILTYDRQLGVQNLLLQALNGNRAEAVVSLPGGEYEVDASPVLSDGTVTGIVLLLFDVTQKLQAEQLRREFTANVSHELKTPLQSIAGYAELMAGGMVPPGDTASCCQIIHTEAQRMIRLVEDILKLSQLDEGKRQMQPEQTDLYRLASQTVNELSASAVTAGVRLELEGQSTPMHSIPELLSGILTNLCSNAIKYNRPGGSVTIRVGRTEKEVSLSVVDTGIGIPAEHQGRIFERFYRVDKSRSKEVGGTGLGLSIVKHAAQALNGRIELESAPGKGTTVTVRFPQ